MSKSPLSPGEFRDVDVPGGDLKASLMPLPYKEPSATLFQLWVLLLRPRNALLVRRIWVLVRVITKKCQLEQPLRYLSEGAVLVSAVHKRLHASLKHELKMLGALFAQDPRPYPYDVGVDGQIKSQDFDGRIDILPVSDPNIFLVCHKGLF